MVGNTAVIQMIKYAMNGLEMKGIMYCDYGITRYPVTWRVLCR